MTFPPVQKMVTAAVVGAVGWGYTVIDSAPSAVTASEWLALATVAAAAAGVWAVPNSKADA